MLLACLLLLLAAAAAAAKPSRCTLDTKKGYKTKTGSTSSVTLTLTLTLTLTPPPSPLAGRLPDPRPDPPLTPGRNTPPPRPPAGPPPTPGWTPPSNCPPPPPPPRVLTDSWGVCRIRTGCSRPPVPLPLGPRTHGPQAQTWAWASALFCMCLSRPFTRPQVPKRAGSFMLHANKANNIKGFYWIAPTTILAITSAKVELVQLLPAQRQFRVLKSLNATPDAWDFSPDTQQLVLLNFKKRTRLRVLKADAQGTVVETHRVRLDTPPSTECMLRLFVLHGSVLSRGLSVWVFLYHQGKCLDWDKIDVDKFGIPPSYQIFPSISRMLCARMCAPDTGCRGGALRATCRGNAQHRDETRRQLTLCSRRRSRLTNGRNRRPYDSWMNHARCLISCATQ